MKYRHRPVSRHLHNSHSPFHQNAAAYGPLPSDVGLGPLSKDQFSHQTNEILGKIVPQELATWLVRASSFGPPEIVGIFKMQIASIGNLLSILEATDTELPWFTADLVRGDESTFQATTLAMTENESRGCLQNLFWGPEEIQALAFLSVVVARLSFEPTAKTVPNSKEV